MDVSDVDDSQLVVVSGNCDGLGSSNRRSGVDIHIEVEHRVRIFVALALENESAHLSGSHGGP